MTATARRNFRGVCGRSSQGRKGVVMRCVGPQTRGRECVLAGADVMIHTGELGVQMNKDSEKWKDYVGLPPDAYCEMDPAKEKDMIAFLVAHNTALEPDFMATDRGFPSMWKRVQEESHAAYSDPQMLAYYPEFASRICTTISSPKRITSRPTRFRCASADTRTTPNSSAMWCSGRPCRGGFRHHADAAGLRSASGNGRDAGRRAHAADERCYRPAPNGWPIISRSRTSARSKRASSPTSTL
jgi:hypothetical protein